MNKSKKNKLIIVERTPLKYYCVACACPSVFETNSETYIIVGRKLDLKDMSQEVKNKIGDGEIAVEIPKGLLDELSK